MIGDKVQRQEGGDGAQLVQSEHIGKVEIHNHYGLDTSEALNLINNFFRDNIATFTDVAVSVGKHRQKEFVDDYLDELFRRDPSASSELRSPGLQMALLGATKEYIKSGDKKLEKLLIELLVDRTRTSQRCLKQIVLEEALTVAAKLPNEYLDFMTVSLLALDVRWAGLRSLEDFAKALQCDLIPFVSYDISSSLLLDHLKYLGCANTKGRSIFCSAEDFFTSRYMNLFSKGFTWDELRNESMGYTWDQSLLEQCRNNAVAIQFASETEETFFDTLKTLSLPPGAIDNIGGLQRSTMLTQTEVRKTLVEMLPPIRPFFGYWASNHVTSDGVIRLTQIGQVIAAANFTARTGRKIEIPVLQ